MFRGVEHKMEKWKIFVIFLLNSVSAFGEGCIKESGSSLHLQYCNSVDLKFNKISVHPDDVTEIHGLRTSNKLSTLNDSVFERIGNLEFLELDYSKIFEISGNAFRGLKSLKHLNLRGNEIKYLDEHVFEPLTNLEWLDLTLNKIEYFGNNLLQHNPKLKKLSLSGNKISYLDPDLLAKLPNLEDFGISGNNITALNKQIFAKNWKLKNLHFKDCQINAIERGTFQYLSELSWLDLGGNKCINKTYGNQDMKPKIRQTEVNQHLENCYNIYGNESSFVETTELNYIVIGSLSLLLFISLLTNVIQYMIKTKNRATPEESLEMNEPGVSFYCSQNILDSNAGTSSGKIYEFAYRADGEVHVYETVPKKPSKISH
jgi:Leucine-rich repeat (LRR) protein